jgi:hypothetical protein
MSTEPDAVKSLAKGGLTPEDIDYVLYSHVLGDLFKSMKTSINPLNRFTGIISASPEIFQHRHLSLGTEHSIC